MENRLIKQVVRIGNSAGVVLPKAWLNQRASVELVIRDISDIFKEIIEILQNEVFLNKVLGIYLVGSYARDEENPASDIDVLVITEDINKSIKHGLYELLLISKKELKQILMIRALPLLPMIKEAKPLLNAELLNEFATIPLTQKNIKWHIETTKLALKENKKLIDMTKKLGEKKVGDSVAYSLILRLRGTYIIDCLKKNKLWNNKEFVKLIKKIACSSLAYERYLYIKNDTGKNKSILPIDEAEKLLNNIEKSNYEQEKWLKELKE